jgi:antitoxin component YwqK of YwqJK toxin-antitoxin module
MKVFIVGTIFIISASVGLNGQATISRTDPNGLKQGRWIGKYSNGAIRYDGSFINDKPVGEWKRFHENGRIKARLSHLPNSDKVSAELFDINGIRYAKGNYTGTLKDSTWNYYNNQRLVGQENFSGGVKNGRSLSFFESGLPAVESYWMKGSLNGVIRRFYPTGQKKVETMYRMGKRDGPNLIYYESGKVEISGQYLNDLSDGIWKFTDDKGVVRYELKYKAGVLLNPEIADSIEAGVFRVFDSARGKLKDPEDFSKNPEEYPRD